MLTFNFGSNKAWEVAKAGLKMALRAAEDMLDGVPVPGAKGVVTILLRIADNIDKADSNEQTLKELTGRVNMLKEDIFKKMKDEETMSAAKEMLQEQFESLTESLQKHSTALEVRHKDNRFLRILNATSNKESLETAGIAIDRLLSNFTVNTVASISKALSESTEETLVNQLPRNIYASYRSQWRLGDPGTCFENTREDVLKEIKHWAQNESANEPSLLWLHGQAGIGKSTIAHTIAQYLDEKKILGGNYMFRRSGADDGVKDAEMVFPTLAFQLAQFDAKIRSHIAAVLRKIPDCHTHKLRAQFTELILNPLCKLQENSQIIVFILDGLDECQPEDFAAEILSLFLEHQHSFPFLLRILVTSRPERYICEILDVTSTGLDNQNLETRDTPYITNTGVHVFDLSQHVPNNVVNADIEMYLKMSLTRTWNSLETEKREHWPKESDLKQLVSQSGKLFAYAATIVRFISNSSIRDPQAQLETILQLDTRDQFTTALGESEAIFGKIDKIYLHIIRKALPDDSSYKHIKLFQAVISVIVLLREPLSVTSLSRLARRGKHSIDEKKIRKVLHHLHSVIIVPRTNEESTLQVYHTSFSSFITSSARCTHRPAYIDPDFYEAVIFGKCFELMAQNDISPSLYHYCVEQWPNHLGNVTPAPGNHTKLIQALLNLFIYGTNSWSNKLLARLVPYAVMHGLTVSSYWIKDQLQIDPIELQFYELTVETSVNQFVPTGNNLCVDHKIYILDKDDPDVHYGFKMFTNPSNPAAVFPYIYYLKNHEFRQETKTMIFYPFSSVVPGSTHTYGFGTNSQHSGPSDHSFKLKQDQLSNFSLLRIILSTERIHDLIETFFMESFDREPPTQIWSIIDIPIYLMRRGPAWSHDEDASALERIFTEN